MEKFDLNNIFQGISTLLQSDPSIMYARIGLILLGILLVYLGRRGILEPLVMIPMGLGMAAVNAGVLIMPGGVQGNLFLDPMVTDTDQLMNILQIDFLQPVYTFTFSNGLTAFLTTQAGVNSGFMIVQYAAASMVSENKIYAHPASVDSIPSSANQEDIVSMGTTAARKAKMILQNTQDVLADELMTACQAIDIRRRLNTHGQGMTPLHEALYQHVREKVAFYEIDREIWPDIRAVEAMIRSGELLDIVKEYIPDFE